MAADKIRITRRTFAVNTSAGVREYLLHAIELNGEVVVEGTSVPAGGKDAHVPAREWLVHELVTLAEYGNIGTRQKILRGLLEAAERGQAISDAPAQAFKAGGDAEVFAALRRSDTSHDDQARELLANDYDRHKPWQRHKGKHEGWANLGLGPEELSEVGWGLVLLEGDLIRRRSDGNCVWEVTQVCDGYFQVRCLDNSPTREYREWITTGMVTLWKAGRIQVIRKDYQPEYHAALIAKSKAGTLGVLVTAQDMDPFHNWYIGAALRHEIDRKAKQLTEREPADATDTLESLDTGEG